MNERRFRYEVKGFTHDKRGVRVMIVVEWTNGVAVNEYTAYDRGTFLDLYPRRNLKWIGIPMTKKQISIHDTVRAY